MAPADFVVEYLGGIESISSADALICEGSAYDPLPDCCHRVTGVRTHLLLCVLTL
jgi:hypothetical protein